MDTGRGIRCLPAGTRITPITKHEADRYIAQTHRHLRPPNGWLFGCALRSKDGEIIGVACAARPSSRMLQDGETCEITRVATTGEYANVCSLLYGALRRAATALGYTRIYTYTRVDEPGTTPRAAGFVLDGESAGGEWSRPSRGRRSADDPTPKNRWIWTSREKAA